MSAITAIWGKSDSQLKADRVDLASRRLKSSADLFIVEAEGKVLDAKAALADAETKSISNADFGALVAARIAVKTAEITLVEGRKAIDEYFPPVT